MSRKNEERRKKKRGTKKIERKTKSRKRKEEQQKEQMNRRIPNVSGTELNDVIIITKEIVLRKNEETRTTKNRRKRTK